MIRPLSGWTDTLRASINRRVVEHRLAEVVARLPYEPESRCAYQHLLEEHMRLTCGGKPQGREKKEGSPG